MKKLSILLILIGLVLVIFWFLRPTISNNYYEKGDAFSDSLKYEQSINYYNKAITFDKKN